MPIQSASALGAYLTASSTAPVSDGISTLDEGALAQRRAAAERSPASDMAVRTTLQDAEAAPADGAPSTGGPMPALYGSNARSVAGSVARSISLLA